MVTLSPKSIHWKLRQNFHTVVLRQNYFFGEPEFLRPSTDFMSPTPIMEGNLLYSKSVDFSVHLKKNIITSTATSGLILDQRTGH